jgi:phage host-nuclease inhibitor protein Gam
MSKQKFAPLHIATAEGLDAAVAEFVKLKLDHACLQVAVEKEKAEIEKRYQPRIAQCVDDIERHFFGVQAFCEERRAEVFGPEKKSRDLTTASFGFRTNPPSVQIVKKKMKWPDVAKLLLSLKWGKAFVLYPEPEVDKKSLITCRNEISGAELAQAGIAIEQEEQFFIEPKSEVLAGDSKVA